MKVQRMWLLALFIRQTHQAQTCSNGLMSKVCCDGDGAGPCKSCPTGSSLCDGTTTQLTKACDYTDASCSAAVSCAGLSPYSLALQTQYGDNQICHTQNTGVKTASGAWGTYFNQGESTACAAFDCEIKRNTAANNDCSSVDNTASTYGVSISNYGTTSVDTTSANWPGVQYFKISCKGQDNLVDAACISINVFGSSGCSWAANSVATYYTLYSSTFYYGSGTSNQIDQTFAPSSYFRFCQTACEFDHCQVFKDVSTSPPTSSQIITSVSKESGDSFKQTADTSTLRTETATLRCFGDSLETIIHDMGTFTLAVKYCSAAFSTTESSEYSYTLSTSGSVTATVFASGANYASTSDSTNCPILSYELANPTDTAAFTHAAIALDTSTGALTFTYDNALITDAIFKIRIKSTATHGYITTGQIQVKTSANVCDSTSSVISEGSYPSGQSSTQEVATGSSAYFVLPSYSVSPLSCTLTTYQSSDNTVTVNLLGSGFVNNPISVSGNKHVVPQSTSLEASYAFKVWVTATGGKIEKFSYTLIVGCVTGVTSSVTWTSFPQNPYIAIGGTGIDAYAIVVPQVSPSYCSVTSYVVLNQALLSNAASCQGSQPCTSLDLDMTSINSLTDLTFNIQLTLGSSIISTSSQETLKIYCSANHVTMSVTFDQQSLTLTRGDTSNNEISFDPPTCNYQVCCSGLQFMLMFVDSSESNLSTTSSNSILSTPSFDSNQGKYLSTVNKDSAIDFSVKLIIETSQFTNTKGEAVKYQQFSGILPISISNACEKDIFSIQVSKDTHFTNSLVPLANVNTTIGNFTDTLDFSGIFTSSRSSYCPMQNFKIWKTDPEQYFDYFEISSKGVFQLKTQSKAIDECKVYLSAYNGQIWSDSQLTDYHVLVDIHKTLASVPNIAPIIDGIEGFTITIQLIDDQLSYQVPSAYDPIHNDTLSYAIQNADYYSQLLSFDPEALLLNLNQSPNIQSFQDIQLTLVITDSHYAESQYQISFDTTKIQQVEEAFAGVKTDVAQEIETEQSELEIETEEAIAETEEETVGVSIDPGMFEDDEEPVYNVDGTIQVKPEFKFPIKTTQEESKPLNFKCKAGSTGNLALIFNQDLIPSRKFKRRKLDFVDNLSKVMEFKYYQYGDTHHGDIPTQKYEVNFVELSEDHRSMIFQMDFDKPLDVSQGDFRDKVRMIVFQKYFTKLFVNKDGEMIKFNQQRVDLLECDASLPQQAPPQNSTEFKSFEQQAIAAVSQKNAGLITILVNYVLKAAFGQIWSAAYALQLITYLTLIDIMYAQCTADLFKTMIELAAFDILPEQYYQPLQQYLLPFHSDKGYSQALMNIKYDTGHMLQNMFFVWFLVFLQLLYYIVFFAVYYGTKRTEQARLKQLNVYAKSCLLDRYSFFQQALLGCALEIFVNCLIEIVMRQTLGPYAKVSFYFQLAVLITMFWFCRKILSIYKYEKYKMEDPERFPVFCNKWGVIWQDLNLKDDQSYPYQLFFIVRRMIFAFILIAVPVYTDMNTFFQYAMVLQLNLLSVIYKVKNVPYIEPSRNKMEQFNDYVNLLISSNLMISMKTMPVNNASMLYNIGLISNYMLLSMIGVNLIFVVNGMIYDFRRSWLRKKNYYKEKARIQELIKSLQNKPKEKEQMEKLENQLEIVKTAENLPDQAFEVDAILIEEHLDVADKERERPRRQLRPKIDEPKRQPVKKTAPKKKNIKATFLQTIKEQDEEYQSSYRSNLESKNDEDPEADAGIGFFSDRARPAKVLDDPSITSQRMTKTIALIPEPTLPNQYAFVKKPNYVRGDPSTIRKKKQMPVITEEAKNDEIEVFENSIFMSKRPRNPNYVRRKK